MESLEDSNCHSLSDTFSLYERYMRSFSIIEQNRQQDNILKTELSESLLSNNVFGSVNKTVNIDTISVNRDGVNECAYDVLNEQTYQSRENSRNSENTNDKNIVNSMHSTQLCCNAVVEGSSSSSLVTGENSFSGKIEPVDLPISSDDTKSNHSYNFPKPVIITSLITMENSNNAVDSVPLFRDVRSSETVFKLPNTELSFNGTIKHVQKLKPMVDPITVLTSVVITENHLNNNDNKELVKPNDLVNGNVRSGEVSEEKSFHDFDRVEDYTNGDSQYKEFILQKNGNSEVEDSMDTKYSLDKSSSSYEASFDSGVRSPDMFSDGDEDIEVPVENFWNFIKKFEVEERSRVKKMEVSCLFHLDLESTQFIIHYD